MRTLLVTLSLFCALCITQIPDFAFADHCEDGHCEGHQTTNEGGQGQDTFNTDNSTNTTNEGGQGGDGGDALALQGQLQGQEQSQVGVNTLEADLSNSNNNTDVNVVEGGSVQIGNFGGYENEEYEGEDAGSVLSPSASQDQSQVGINEQEQSNVGVNEQSQSGYNSNGDFSGDIFTVEGDTTTVQAPRIPVNSAAASIGGSCNSGIAASFKDVSASIGSGSVLCDLLAVARGYAAVGDVTTAVKVLDEAHAEARFQKTFSRIRTVLTLGLIK